jgi:hypothetical protein
MDTLQSSRRSSMYASVTWSSSSIKDIYFPLQLKRRTKNAKAFHDKCGKRLNTQIID